MTITYNKQILIKRGNTAVSSAYTGPVGEITLDTDLNTIRTHDGATRGGHLLATSGQLSTLANTISNVAALTYSDANVSSYLARFDGNIQFISDPAEISGVTTIYLNNYAMTVDGTGNLFVGGNLVSGSEGPQGIQGNVGPRGPQGNVGPQGPQGIQGNTGPQGVQGPQGSQGPIGPQGIQGNVGQAGGAGPRGPKGDQGISVTLIGNVETPENLPITGNIGDGYIVTTVGNLFFWNSTISLWVDIGPIVGPAGPEGPQGQLGPQGPAGPQGIQGIQGEAGPAGPQGIPGAAGPTGAQGPAGAQGPVGPQGPAGPQGAQGPIGLTGPQGIQGNTGPQGNVGPVGPQGPAGIADTGDVYFNGTTIYSNVGLQIDNSDLDTAYTARAYFPANGDSIAPVQIYNELGNVDIISGLSGTIRNWTFDRTGNFVPGSNSTQNIGSVASQVKAVYTSNVFVGQRIVFQDNTFLSSANGLDLTGTKVTVANVSPVNTTGNLWYNTNDGRMYIAYANVWLDANPQTVPGNMVSYDTDGALALEQVSVQGNIVPTITDAYTLGNVTNYWKDVYVSGNITANVDGYSIGYRNVPQISFTTSSILDNAAGGKHYYSTLGSDNTITIADSTSVSYAVGMVATIVNRGTGNITIDPGAGVSLYLAGNSTASSRILSSYGMATLINLETDVWMINGTGLT